MADEQLFHTVEFSSGKDDENDNCSDEGIKCSCGFQLEIVGGLVACHRCLYIKKLDNCFCPCKIPVSKMVGGVLLCQSCEKPIRGQV